MGCLWVWLVRGIKPLTSSDVKVGGLFPTTGSGFSKTFKNCTVFVHSRCGVHPLKVNMRKTPLFLSLLKNPDPAIGSAFLKSVKNLGVFVLSRCRVGISPFLSVVQRFLVLVNHSIADLARLGTCLVVVSLL